MNNEIILQELENITNKLGVTIRYEDGDFIGGMCRINDEKFVIVNKRLLVNNKIKIIAKEVSNLNIEEIFILPAIKEIILENRKLNTSDIKRV